MRVGIGRGGAPATEPLEAARKRPNNSDALAACPMLQGFDIGPMAPPIGHNVEIGIEWSKIPEMCTTLYQDSRPGLTSFVASLWLTRAPLLLC